MNSLPVNLLPERAAHAPGLATLLVADLHLGKAAVFRARGIPVPQGTTSETLHRLSAVLERTGVQRLVVLGDFLHARESHAAPTLDALARWRRERLRLPCFWLRGRVLTLPAFGAFTGGWEVDPRQGRAWAVTPEQVWPVPSMGAGN